MLDSNNEQMIKIAIAGLSPESQKKNYPADKYLKKLKEKIFNKTKTSHQNEFLQIALNISRISEEAKLRALDDLFREDLLNLFYSEEETTDSAEAI